MNCVLLREAVYHAKAADIFRGSHNMAPHRDSLTDYLSDRLNVEVHYIMNEHIRKAKRAVRRAVWRELKDTIKDLWPVWAAYILIVMMAVSIAGCAPLTELQKEENIMKLLAYQDKYRITKQFCDANNGTMWLKYNKLCSRWTKICLPQHRTDTFECVRLTH